MKALNIRGDYGDELRTYTSKTYALGTRMHLPDGRVLRYSRAASTALGVARVVQAARQNARVADIALDFPFLSQRSFSLSLSSATTIALDTYEDGLLFVNDGLGEGHVYHVVTNKELGAGRTLILDIDSDFVTSPNTTTRVTMLHNRYNLLTLAAAPPISEVVGITPASITANSYFWLQTSGPCAVLQQDDLEVYLPVAASQFTRGAVEVATVMVPNISGERHGVTGMMQQPVFSDDAGPLKGRLAPATGVGVVPTIPIGYVLSPREHGQHCLIQLTLE